MPFKVAMGGFIGMARHDSERKIVILPSRAEAAWRASPPNSRRAERQLMNW